MFHTPSAILRKAISPSEVGFAREDGRSPYLLRPDGSLLKPRGSMFGVKSLRCYGFWHMIPWLHDAGWHLSYFGGVGPNLRKMKSYSDGVDLGVCDDDAEQVLSFFCVCFRWWVWYASDLGVREGHEGQVWRWFLGVDVQMLWFRSAVLIWRGKYAEFVWILHLSYLRSSWYRFA